LRGLTRIARINTNFNREGAETPSVRGGRLEEAQCSVSCFVWAGPAGRQRSQVPPPPL
jgi:hypothetical protein